MKLHRSHAKPKPLSGSFRYGSMRVVQFGPVYIVANACLSALVRIWRRGVTTSAYTRKYAKPNAHNKTLDPNRKSLRSGLGFPSAIITRTRHYRIMPANVCCYALCVCAFGTRWGTRRDWQHWNRMCLSPSFLWDRLCLPKMCFGLWVWMCLYSHNPQNTQYRRVMIINFIYSCHLRWQGSIY